MSTSHSKYSASSSERWMNCPGSVKLSEGVETFESEYAKEGTRWHEVCEKLLKAKRPRVEAERMLDKKLYPKEMVDYALDALKLVESLTPEGADVLPERKVNTSPILGYPNQFGTLDVSILEHFGTLTIIDFKYGAGVPVEVKDNTQLILYALAVLHEHDYNFHTVKIVVFQPRAEHEKGPVREYTMDMDTLLRWPVHFKEAVQACESENPELEPGDWCRWCPGKAKCPAISEKAFKSAQIAFAEETPPIKLERVNQVTALPQPWHSMDLTKFLNAADKLEIWIQAIREFAFQHLSRGHKIEGWKLVAKRSTRKWVNEKEAEKFFKRHYGNKAFTKPELLSPAQMEKALKSVITSRNKNFSPKKLVDKFTTNISTGATMVQESDKRPALNPAKDVFTEIEG